MSSLLPLLFILACPLMMIFMMRGMHGGHGRSGGAGVHDHAAHQGGTRETDAAELEALRADLQARMDELDVRIEELERAKKSNTRALIGA